MDLSTISSVNSLVSLDTLTASPRAAIAAQRCGVFVVDFADQLAELIDHAAVKGRLHHAPLPAPESAFAGHDAVAKQDLDPINALALGVIAVIGQQHPFDVVGMIDDVVEYSAAGREYPVDIAESGKVVLQSRQRFIAAAEIEAFGRPRRNCYGLHAGIVT